MSRIVFGTQIDLCGAKFEVTVTVDTCAAASVSVVGAAAMVIVGGWKNVNEEAIALSAKSMNEVQSLAVDVMPELNREMT